MSAPTNDKLSIIVTYYDPDGVVRPKLEQLLTHLRDNQLSYPETEIILISDGTDTSWVHEFCDKIGGPDGVCVNYGLPNMGVSWARNKGLELATGQYIAFCDADDDIEPYYAHTIYQIMRQGYDYALFPFVAVAEGAVSFIREEMIGNYAVWAWCFNRRIIGDERFDENLNVAEDVDFLRRVIFPELNGYRSDTPIYRYDWSANPNSLSKRFNRGDLPHKKSDTKK